MKLFLVLQILPTIHRENVIEFVSDVLYLGIALSTELSQSVHMTISKSCGPRFFVDHMFEKTEPPNIFYYSAYRLLLSVYMPSAFYAALLFAATPILTVDMTSMSNQLLDFFRKCCGISNRILRLLKFSLSIELST